jgi:hypothetical protein
MAKKAVVIFAAVLICATAIAVETEKAGNRVLVIPFEGRDGAFKSSDAALTSAAVEAVKADKKFVYVSPEQFAKNWMKVLTDKERKLFKEDPESEMKDLKRYRKAFAQEDLGTIAGYRDRWGVDLVIIGRVAETGPEQDEEPKLVTQIIGMETGRFFTVSKTFEPDDAKAIMKKEVARLLTKSDAVRKVDADGVLAAPKSIVGYDVKATNGQYLRVVFDYSSERPDPVIQKIDVAPHRPIKDGILPLKVQTEEKKPITFQYYFKAGQFVNIKITTDPPAGSGAGAGSAGRDEKDKGDKAKEKALEESLTVKSAGGYAIKFTFQWKDGEVKGIRAEPVVNPYGAVK